MNRVVQLLTSYDADHQDPVNRGLHAIGQPMVGLSFLLMVWKFWWGVGVFLTGYAIMFAGHFVFERNLPSLFRNPLYPAVAGLQAARRIWAWVRRPVALRSDR